MFARSGTFRGGWLRGGAAGTAIEAGAIDGSVVVDDRGVVSVMNNGGVHVSDRGVVVIDASAPFATDEADTAVAEAVVDAAVETDVRSPIAGVKEVRSATPAPIAGGPEIAGRGSENPSAGNPEVAVIAVCPIAGSPDVADGWADGLHIDGKRGWPDVNAYADRDLRRSCRRHR